MDGSPYDAAYGTASFEAADYAGGAGGAYAAGPVVVDTTWAPLLDLLGAVALPALALGLLWLLRPYLDWRYAASRPLEAHVARTSFQCAPGELVPPVWKEPEVSLSVVVPAYNEEYRLPQMLDETLSYLEARASASPGSFSYEVIVVDDGSTDATYEAALASLQRTSAAGRCGAVAGAGAAGSAAPRGGELRVVRLATNRGKGFAVRAGMLVARGQLLLMADADGATNIRDLERLEQALSVKEEDGGPHVAFGSRHHLKQEALAKRAWHRNMLMMTFHLIVWLLVGGPIQDTQCGFKLFRSRVGKQIFGSLHIYRWAFDIEVLLLARLFGRPIAEVPVTWIEMPGSKLNLITGSATMLRDIVLLQVLNLFGVWCPSA